MISSQLIYHITIIANDNARSKHFYYQVLYFLLVGKQDCVEWDY